MTFRTALFIGAMSLLTVHVATGQTPVEPQPRTFPPMPHWEVARDSIRLMWSNGFAPTAVVVHRIGSDLVGKTTALTDVHFRPEPPRPSAPVTFHPRPCR
jgi:hypothetical protein